jgi:hypothetical protein
VYTDRNLAGGVYSYRLKQIDCDGEYKYSPEARARVQSTPADRLVLNNFPNPFNPVTKIEFSVPERRFATLKVFNSVGQEVAALFGGQAEAGRLYSIAFDAAKLSGGVFFARLECGGESAMRKLIVMK